MALGLALCFFMVALVRGLQRVLPKHAPRTLVTAGFCIFAAGMTVALIAGSSAPPGSPGRDWVASGGIALALLGGGIIAVGQLEK